eukprot:31187-Pelagococcus_subviridis.AAC.2
MVDSCAERREVTSVAIFRRVPTAHRTSHRQAWQPRTSSLSRCPAVRPPSTAIRGAPDPDTGITSWGLEEWPSRLPNSN